GGVYVTTGDLTFTLAGSAEITGNTAGHPGADLYLANGQRVTIGGPLEGSGKIKVHAMGASTGGVFTSGWSDSMSGKDPADYFTPDDDAYVVILQGDEAALHEHLYQYSADDAADTFTETCSC